MTVYGRGLGPLSITRVDNAEHCRHEEQRRTSGEQQAADHCAAEPQCDRIFARRILDLRKDAGDFEADGSGHLPRRNDV